MKLCLKNIKLRSPVNFLVSKLYLKVSEDKNPTGESRNTNTSNKVSFYCRITIEIAFFLFRLRSEHSNISVVTVEIGLPVEKSSFFLFS
jgi:hypothetical protein